jgi:membrane fusion protein (multidrug efflux system)
VYREVFRVSWVISKVWTKRVAGGAMIAALASGTWVLAFHGDWLKPTPSVEAEETVETEVPVHIATITRATLHRYADGYGLVAPEPAHDGRPPASAHVASPMAGVLAQSSCAEGDRVEKGATLFQLDARTATAEEHKAAAARASAKAALTRLGAMVEFAEREHERTKQLQAGNLASEKDLREAELRAASARHDLTEAVAKQTEADQSLAAAQTQRSLLKITAPLAGTVTKVRVNPGEAVDVSTMLADIVDLERLIVAATLPATELPSLKIGQLVDLHLADRAASADPKTSDAGAADQAGAAYHGTLAFIGFEVDPQTNTVAIRIAVPSDAGLRPGQYMRARVVVEERPDCLVVPAASLANGAEGTPVIAIIEGDKATQHAVLPGLREGGLVEIQGEGLKAGATVVTAGAYGLPKETKVRVLGP